MRISDWSSDVCSSDLPRFLQRPARRDVICEVLRLPPDRRLPAEPEPGEILVNAALEFGAAAAGIDVLHAQQEAREEERSVGKACVSTVRSRWWPSQSQKQKLHTKYEACMRISK